MGTINPWNICSGLIFVRITPPWKKLVVFFFKNAKHVRIISKERRVRKFVESLEFFSPRVIHRSRRKWSLLLVESFFRSFPLELLSIITREDENIRPVARRKSISSSLYTLLRFLPFIFLGRMGFLIRKIRNQWSFLQNFDEIFLWKLFCNLILSIMD